MRRRDRSRSAVLPLSLHSPPSLPLAISPSAAYSVRRSGDYGLLGGGIRKGPPKWGTLGQAV